MHGLSFTDGTRQADRLPRTSFDHPTALRISGDAAEVLDAVRAQIERSQKGAQAQDVRLVVLLALHAATEVPCARGGLAPWQQRKLKHYVGEHLHQPLHLRELAQQVSLSVSHFSRAFKKTFGTTPHAHILHLRVEMAQQLMLTTEEPLSRIALACGLADQAHLSKLFRRSVGETPYAWRRRKLNDAQVNCRRLAEGQDVSPPLAA